LATAYEKFTGFEEGTDFRAWVFRIATFTLLNQNRRWKKEATLPLDEEPVAWEAELERECRYEELLNDPERVLGQLDGELRRAILELTERERVVLLLTAVGGFTCQEAASLLEIPMGSVMGYLARGRAKVRERLACAVRSGA
jgi:RNA polymerase sigma-70 factor (ECF subfamily)